MKVEIQRLMTINAFVQRCNAIGIKMNKANVYYWANKKDEDHKYFKVHEIYGNSFVIEVSDKFEELEKEHEENMSESLDNYNPESPNDTLQNRMPRVELVDHS